MFQAFSPSNLSDFHLARGAAEEVRGRHTCHLARPALAAGLLLPSARSRRRRKFADVTRVTTFARL